MMVSIDTKKILVLDESGLFTNALKDKDKITFDFSTGKAVEEVKKNFTKEGYDALLFIPKMTVEKTENPLLYSENSLGFTAEEEIVNNLENEIKDRRLHSAGIDPKKLESLEPHFSLGTKEISETGDAEKDKNTAAATAAGYAGGFMIYMFIFLYGAMVMRGVVEEKTNRIVEIIVSSVKPFHLMMGKVLGISAVALLQLVMWVVFSFGLSTAGAAAVGFFMPQEKMTAMTSIPKTNEAQLNKSIEEQSKKSDPNNVLSEVTKAIDTINLPLIIGGFLFYFIGGYLLYAGIFAAIGSAVDTEVDAQQLMGPVSIPLVLGFILSQMVIQNPDSGLGIALSLFPLTSPITMVMRLPFGVPVWELVTSMVILVASFVGSIWLSGRIFRVGILLYGKKPTWKKMLVWVFSKN